MKYLSSTCLCFLLLFFNSRAQNSFQSSTSFTGATINVNGNDLRLPSYEASTDKIEGSSYFSKDWVPCSVTTSDNNFFSKNL